MALNWLLPQYQQSLLRVLYENPSTPFHISELARRAKIDSGNTKRYIDKFAQQKLVNLHKAANLTLVSPNFTSPEIAKIFEFFEVDRSQSFLGKNQPLSESLGPLTDALLDKIEGIQIIALFGPCARIDEEEKREVITRFNMAIVVSNGFHTADLNKEAAKLAKLHAPLLEISPTIIDAKDFESGWEKRDSFCCDLWQQRVILYGESYYWNHVARLGVPE